MTIYASWEIAVAKALGGGTSNGDTMTFGVPDNKVVLNDRLLGASLSLTTKFGEPGRGSAIIELDNSDGYLTPFPYDSDFLYDTTRFYDGLDWFSNGVVVFQPLVDLVDGTTAYGVPTFTGIPTAVDVEDDGFNSRVIVTCEDPFTLLARSTIGDFTGFGGQSLVQLLEYLMNSAFATTPLLGANDYDSVIYLTEQLVRYRGVNLNYSDDTTLDVVYTDLCRIEYGLALPLALTFASSSSLTFLRYDHNVIPTSVLHLDQTVPVEENPLFFRGADTIADGRYDPDTKTTVYDLLPFRTPTFGTNLEELVTEASVQSIGETLSSSASANIATYGARAVRHVQVPAATPEYNDGKTAKQFTDEQAAMLTTWFDTPSYGIASVEITGGMIQSYCNDAALGAVRVLLERPRGNGSFGSIGGALFRQAFITGTGSGGATIGDEVGFFGLELSIVPNDWVIRLTGGRKADNIFGLVLDDSEFGVLDENRVAGPTGL